MTCRAKGTARAGTRTDGGMAGDGISSTGRPLFSPLFSIIPHLARLSPRLPLISTAGCGPSRLIVVAGVLEQ